MVIADTAVRSTQLALAQVARGLCLPVVPEDDAHRPASTGEALSTVCVAGSEAVLRPSAAARSDIMDVREAAC